MLRMLARQLPASVPASNLGLRAFRVPCTSGNRRTLTAEDVMPLQQYAAKRDEIRAARIALKKSRRVQLGPHASIAFESYESMWYQVQEMLWIEKGGDEQVPHELEAYRPLVPPGDALTFTLMFEIDNEDRRNRILRALGHVEDTIALHVESAGLKIPAEPASEDGIERTSAEGKTSAVHFLRFPINAEARAALSGRTDGGKAPDVVVSVGHSEYPHMTRLPDDLVARLVSEDLD